MLLVGPRASLDVQVILSNLEATLCVRQLSFLCYSLVLPHFPDYHGELIERTTLQATRYRIGAPCLVHYGCSCTRTQGR